MADSATKLAPTGEQPTIALADLSELSNYIQKVASCLFEESSDGVNSLKTVLNEGITRDRLKNFVADAQTHTLIIQKLPSKDVDDEEVEVGTSYIILTEVTFTNPKTQSLVFIKRSGYVEAEKGFSAQFRVLNFTDGSPFETLHSMVSNAIGPFYKSYIRESGRATRDGDKLAPSVEETMAKLELGLLHLQQDIDIPEITLTINPIVAEIIKKRAAAGQRAVVSDFQTEIEDTRFLHVLQNGVFRWIKEIKKVTDLDRDPASGTTLQEITFWLNLERSLTRIQEKRQSFEVTLTLDILKNAKRFLVTAKFDSDTGLTQALEKVHDYNPLMKDFPLNDLLSATELSKIQPALQAIFTHLRKIRNTKYPLQRAVKLIDAISKDLSSQLLKVFGTRRLMHMPFKEFEEIICACNGIFATWEDEFDRLSGVMREISKKKRDEHMRIFRRTNLAHHSLQQRLDHMQKFRAHHEQLRQVIVRVLRPAPSRNTKVEESVVLDDQIQNGQAKPSDNDSSVKDQPLFDSTNTSAVDEVNMAYEIVKEVDCLDVTLEGSNAWSAAVKRYDERIDRVETRITARLRDLLGTAKNANEMFRYFSRFNALFVRPHIQGAIREYQTQLIQRVKDDIDALHSKFKAQYITSKAYHMTKLRDIPPIAGSIIWARQIERQLCAYLRRVEDVLGKDWGRHRDGTSLKNDGESFKTKLNTLVIFNDWANKVQLKAVPVSGRIFNIEPIRARVANKDGETQTVTVLKLKVNFQLDVITLAKEVVYFLK